jgi:dipeptidyl aminopeptidase/acylaminoacyl peptidase
MRRIFGSLFIIAIVLVIGVLLVIYAQGTRLDKDGKLIGVGIIQIDTTPNDADIYINGKFRDKSDINIENLKPGNYTLKIQKNRYHTWEKLVEVKEGIITPLKVSLFLSNPSLTALTSDGVFLPKLSPDKKFVVFGKQTAKDPGIYVVEVGSGQFFFGNTNEEKKVLVDSNDFAFSKSSFEWSPDSKSVLVQSQKHGSTETKYFLIDPKKNNENPEEVTSRFESLKQTWLTDSQKLTEEKLKKFSTDINGSAKTAKLITFSKDNQAVLIIKPDNSAVVQDLKPSPVPNTKPATYNLPIADSYIWFNGDSKHLISIEGSSINVLDSDGTNKFSLFTGDFDPGAVFGWPDGAKIIISINLNSKSNPLPNLYTIELR